MYAFCGSGVVVLKVSDAAVEVAEVLALVESHGPVLGAEMITIDG